MQAAEASHLRRVASVASAAIANWLESRRAPVVQTAEQREQAARIVAQWGDSFGYFALRADREWFFSRDGNALLAYTTVGKLAYVSGDPIGNPAEIPGLMRDFRDHAHARGQHVVMMATSAAMQETYDAAGLKSLYIGDEALVDAANWTLQGPQMKRVRAAVSSARRAGLTFEMVAPGEIDEVTRQEIRRVSVESRRNQPERGFSMTMDALFRYPDTTVAIARDSDGHVAAFMQVLPLSSTSTFTVPARRRADGSKSSATEFLVGETMEWARQQGAKDACINFIVLGRYLREEKGVVRWALDKADKVVPMRRLEVFARRFRPEWQPRYVTTERYRDLPKAAIACVRLEGFAPAAISRPSMDLAAR